jgi:hypothetical protein
MTLLSVRFKINFKKLNYGFLESKKTQGNDAKEQSTEDEFTYGSS